MIHPLLLALAIAAPPTLTLPAELTARPGQLVTIEAQTQGKAVRWLALDAGLSLVPGELLREQRTTVAVASKPGTYRLMAITCVGEELSLPSITSVIVGEEPAARTTTGKLHLVVIEETAEARAERGAFFASMELAGYLRAKGWAWRVADKDARDSRGRTPADLAPYIVRASGRLPYLMVVDSSGRLRLEGRLPATPAELLRDLKRLGD